MQTKTIEAKVVSDEALPTAPELVSGLHQGRRHYSRGRKYIEREVHIQLGVGGDILPLSFMHYEDIQDSQVHRLL